MADPTRILLIEDNPGDARLLRESLVDAGESGFELRSVDCLRSGLELLRETGFDVVLLDLSLPDARGIETFARAHEEAPHIPIVVLSGTNDQRLAEECVREGAQDYLVKGEVNGHSIARVVRYAIERMRAEKELRRSEAQLRRLIELSPDGVIVVDRDGSIRLANAAMNHMANPENDGGLGGKNVLDLPIPAEAHALQECLQRVFADSARAQRIDSVFVRSDGSPYPVEVNASYLVWEGRPAAQIIARDMAEHRRVQTELENRARQQAAVAELGQSALAVSDTEALLEDAIATIALILNVPLCGYFELDAEQLGMRLRAGIGWGTDDARAIEIPTGTESSAGYAVLANRSVVVHDLHLETRFRTPPVLIERGIVSGIDTIVRGTERPFGVLAAYTTSRRVFTTDDVHFLEAVANVLGTAMDRQQAQAALQEREEQLRQAQKMEAVGMLAGGVAHDFNNLLSAIIGFSELVLMRMPPEDPMRPYIEEVARAGDRAAALTGQLLTFGRRQVLRPESLDVNLVLSDLEQLLRRVIGEDVDLAILLAPEPVRVTADRSQIEQVVMNLAVNARDAMPHGGKLTIETQRVELDGGYARDHVGVRPGAYVMIAVSDTGTGMDAATRARIFEPFFTTKEVGKGTGLGLATVYGIVKQSEGDVWVYTEPGQGTTFKVYLPRNEEVGEMPVRPRAMGEQPRGTETILVVEDEPGVRALVRGVLQATGYSVLEASRGEEALDVLNTYGLPIHLLLTDVVMPGMSGPELASRVEHAHPETKVLYMSGYTGDVAVRHGVLDQGSAYLQKPITPTTLSRKVREVLDAAA
jgi:two-component system, cell cycle sensor histidine kinase and response regulator CckA